MFIINQGNGPRCACLYHCRGHRSHDWCWWQLVAPFLAPSSFVVTLCIAVHLRAIGLSCSSGAFPGLYCMIFLIGAWIAGLSGGSSGLCCPGLLEVCGFVPAGHGTAEGRDCIEAAFRLFQGPDFGDCTRRQSARMPEAMYLGGFLWFPW